MANSGTLNALPDASAPKLPNLRGSELASYKWLIEDIIPDDYSRSGVIRSSSVSAEIDSDGAPVMWFLRLYHKGISRTDAGFFSVYLKDELGICQPIRCQYKISVLDYKSEESNSMECEHYITMYGYKSGVHKYCRKDIYLDKANGLPPGGKFAILCELRIFGEIKKSHLAQLQEHKSALADNIGNLLLNKSFSDVTLVVGDLEIPAHKAILAMRSGVFAKMFQHEMMENKLNRVTIKDVDAEVLQEMLRYIYTGKVAHLDEMAGALFAIADQYNIDKLMDMCEKKLYEQLSLESAVETLILADLHSAEHLKKLVLDFIAENLYGVRNTSAWQNIMQEYPRLIEEILRKPIKRPIKMDLAKEK